MTYTKLGRGFIIRVRSAFLHVGHVDKRGVHRLLNGGGFTLGTRTLYDQAGQPYGYWGVAVKWRGLVSPDA